MNKVLKAKLASYTTAIISVAVFTIAVFQNNETARASLFLFSFITANLCLLTDRNTQKAIQELADEDTAEVIIRQRKLLAVQNYSEPTAPVDVSELTTQWFNLEDIGKDRDKFPNVFILGEPGSGKTTLAQYLGCKLESNIKIAAHPHANPTEFPGFHAVVGGGRNIGEPVDEIDFTLANILKEPQRYSIAELVLAIYEEMLVRYEFLYKGKKNFKTLDVYIDELPAISKALNKKGWLAAYLGQLIMECRKVGIRLWFLTQGLQVKTIGLEGESDLREGATVIRLGTLALKHAKVLLNKGELTAEDYAKILLDARPCLVNDSPATLPTYDEMAKVIAKAH